MTGHVQPLTAKPARPQFGKDHLILADWPIGGAQYQQATKPDGTKTDYAQFVVHRSGAASQKVTLEAPSGVGLPAAGDKDFLIALINFAKDQGFDTDIVHFVPSHVLQFVRLAETRKNYDRLKKALKRLRALTITYENAWYSRTTRAVEPILITGILAEAKIVLRRGRRKARAVPDSYVQWTQNFHRSLQEGTLTDLDLDLYFEWSRPCCKDLHRHLNKVWHAGRKPKVYERDLRELACGHLAMTDSKYLKRNFHQVVQEMEARRYLLPLDETVRYHHVRPGVWRVRLELHPERIRTRDHGAGDWSKAPATSSAAALLVCEYHRFRFGRDTHQPTRSELRHAESLLVRYDRAALTKVIPEVARALAAQAADDLYFGYAAPLVQAALEKRERQRQARERQQARDAEHAGVERSTDDDKARRIHRREQLLARWRDLPEELQRRYRQLAIDRATNDFMRRRLRRMTDLADPPIEFLDAMAADRSQ